MVPLRLLPLFLPLTEAKPRFGKETCNSLTYTPLLKIRSTREAKGDHYLFGSTVTMFSPWKKGNHRKTLQPWIYMYYSSPWEKGKPWGIPTFLDLCLLCVPLEKGEKTWGIPTFLDLFLGICPFQDMASSPLLLFPRGAHTISPILL